MQIYSFGLTIAEFEPIIAGPELTGEAEWADIGATLAAPPPCSRRALIGREHADEISVFGEMGAGLHVVREGRGIAS